MSEPFLAEIRMVGFNFAPQHWAFCDGQILPINQNQSLYSLLGTTYGGDGETTFALPDLRGRTPIHTGNSNGGSPHTLGQRSGEETHTLSANEMPAHAHSVSAAGGAPVNPGPSPTSKVFADSAPNEIYAPAVALEPVAAGSIGGRGGSQAHQNMQPYLALNFCIALQGLFPSSN